MINQAIPTSRFPHWSRSASVLVVLALLAVLIPVPQAPPIAPRAQPILLQMAAARPDAAVRVIVQKLGHDTRAERLVLQLGGSITMDLSLINAFAAQVPARAVATIARAASVRWVSFDAPIDTDACSDCVDTSRATSAWLQATRVKDLWAWNPGLQGQGVSVAVVDSGINPQQDLYTRMGVNRLIAAVRFNDGYNQTVYDNYGHGNHVAGIIGSNGDRSGGVYVGMAPMVNLINVKVSDDEGRATIANVVDGLQWIYENKDRYNIRVVNLSLNATVAESYHTSPLDAAVEILWFNKITVVVSAGNRGAAGLYPPANDPFVITVGATDDKSTPGTSDDTIASFSAYGTTTDGIAKPDLVAPGTNIVSLMANPNSLLATRYPDHVVNQTYFRMSGTSMAAPMVAGAVALLLQDEPHLTPDQVKYRLKATARPFDTPTRAGAGYLDVNTTIRGNTTASTNTGITASRLLWSGPTSLPWQSNAWDSASWGSASWGSASWGSASWGSASWGSDYWGN
jgi:serine protease AprX